MLQSKISIHDPSLVVESHLFSKLESNASSVWNGSLKYSQFQDLELWPKINCISSLRNNLIELSLVSFDFPWPKYTGHGISDSMTDKF